MTGDSGAMPRVFLRPGNDQRISRGHPWAYSNEIRLDPATKELAPGALVRLHRADGKPLGVGSFNPHALIAFRLFDPDPDAVVDADFFAARLHRALALRQRLFAVPYYRLLHAEADGFPGLIADRFGDTMVLQVNTAAMEGLAPVWSAALEAVVAPAVIVLRNDTAMRLSERLTQEIRVEKGDITGPVKVREGAAVYLADVVAGQKTGWFYDQRDNRAAVAAVSAGARVLDVFCHSGGFAIAAALQGARTCVGVDSSELALGLAQQAAAANAVSERCSFRRGDAFEALTEYVSSGERFDVVICDPPAFVKSRKDLATGLRGYRKLARLAATVVAPGGMLFIASCSHNVEAAPFAIEVARGIDAAGRSGRILREGGAAADHPRHLHLPESTYLKSLLIQID